MFYLYVHQHVNHLNSSLQEVPNKMYLIVYIYSYILCEESMLYITIYLS